MFRFIFFFALFFAAVTASPAPKQAIPTVTKVAGNDVDTATSRATQDRTNRNIPTVTDPNELDACRCIYQSEDCSAVLAVSSGLCTAHTLRRRQPDPCVLRCAHYCLYEARNKPVCQSLDGWLKEKVYKLTRKTRN